MFQNVILSLEICMSYQMDGYVYFETLPRPFDLHLNKGLGTGCMCFRYRELHQNVKILGPKPRMFKEFETISLVLDLSYTSKFCVEKDMLMARCRLVESTDSSHYSLRTSLRQSSKAFITS